MKTPPFLLGAALLFWGWQAGLLVEGAFMAAIIESARLFKARWDFSDEDFSRIWTFCTLLVLAAAVHAFTSSGGPENFRGLFRDPSFANQTSAGRASTRAAVNLLRWLPVTTFLFVAAQAFSSREGVPLTTLSLILRRRWQKAKALGLSLPPERTVNIGYPYFALCVFSASAHGGGSVTFFWGFYVLLLWALWPKRSPRFGKPVWLAVAALAMLSGYYGQKGIVQLEKVLEGYNPQWLTRSAQRGFDPQQSRTEIGQIGRIKNSGEIVIRLRTGKGIAPPPYLREASYRIYRSAVWYAGPAREDFQNLTPAADLSTWVLLPRKTNTATLKVASYLNGGKGLLPLPEGSGRLENLPVEQLRTNSVGTVLADGPGLVLFDARYGPGATIDSPATTYEDLDVPPREVSALDQVIADLKLSEATPPREALRAINGFFASKFSYSLWQERTKLASTNDTPLSRFLLQTRSGHCEYFATATVLLLRRLQIPARYAIGWSVHEGGAGDKYVVRQRDAHAWCLVWQPEQQTWVDFDTTPGSWVAAENERASSLQFLSDAWSRFVFEFSKLRWGQTNLRQYLIWIFVPVLVLLLFQIIFRSGRKRHRTQPADAQALPDWPGLDSELYQLEKELAGRGLVRQPGEAVSGWLQRATADPALGFEAGALRSLVRLHYRYRFDPEGINGLERDELRQAVNHCLAGLAKVGGGVQTLVAREAARHLD